MLHYRQVLDVRRRRLSKMETLHWRVEVEHRWVTSYRDADGRPVPDIYALWVWHYDTTALKAQFTHREDAVRAACRAVRHLQYYNERPHYLTLCEGLRTYSDTRYPEQR